MCDKRFSTNQIFYGIQIYWTETIGRKPIEPAMRIDEALKAEGMWDEIDIDDVFNGLEVFFGFSCPVQVWVRHFNLDSDAAEWEKTVAPHFTFGAVAEFIRGRIEGISIEPATILGRACATAGVFVGMKRLARQLVPTIERFGPSTAIGDRIRGPALHQFYSRIRWISEGRLPPARSMTGMSFPLASLVVAASVAFVVVVGSQSFCLGIVAAFILLIAASWTVHYIEMWLSNPVPQELRTFGDVARWIVANPPAR